MPGPLDYAFDHIHIYCSDPPATERWFVEKVGAELVEHRDSLGVPVTVLRLGGARVLLRGRRENEKLAPAGARHFGTDHFALVVSDVDAAIAELRRRGVTVEVEPWNIRPAMRIAFVKGPDEVRIELLQPQKV